MRRVLCSLMLAVAVGGIFTLECSTMAAEKSEKPETSEKGPMLAHMVYFSLNESTPENRKKLIDACKKYLAGEPGTMLFAVGTPSDLNREVNDRDFDVALQLVFKNRAAHDAYQTAEKHQQFIKENKASWKKVRVFDADVEGAK